MVLGVGGALTLAIMYQGVKEAWRFTYISPAMRKGVRGNSGWEEIRYRHPSPGSVRTNEFHGRGIEKQHHKTAYAVSRHYVRNYWDPEFQSFLYQTGNVTPDLKTLSASQEATMLDYIPGDVEGNRQKKLAYEQFYAKAQLQEQTKIITGELAAYRKNPALLREAIRSENANRLALDRLEDEDDFLEPKLPSLPVSQQYRMEYWLHWWTSTEMQLTLELEAFIEGERDEYEVKGIDVYQGNRQNWEVGGGNISPAEQAKVNHYLKLRDAEFPQP